MRWSDPLAHLAVQDLLHDSKPRFPRQPLHVRLQLLPHLHRWKGRSPPRRAPLHLSQRSRAQIVGARRGFVRARRGDPPNRGQGDLRLTREGGERMLLRKDRVETRNSV